ncbi:uncharacterized protein LOC124932756 [Impatiens glandulifera]|uniref:uncharacterized protein LOC124932756 n=1 Tax=Impatiens glandulifera TaxID=253017 RepID=UPI001FB12170|nr:uncharacterized protein LOC124932756 [Impatiens glandulifera]
MDVPATRVQHITKTSSDELLKKFAEVGSESKDRVLAKKELRLWKQQCWKRTRSDQCDSPSNRRSSLGDKKSLIPPASVWPRKSSSSALIRFSRSRLRARDFKNKSIFKAIEKTWCKTIDGATKILMDKHYNRHKRLINDAT